MNNSRLQRNKTKRRGCRRNRLQYGGNISQSYSLGSSVDPRNPSLANGAEIVPFSSCGNARAPGLLYDTGTKGGLPGFAGGGWTHGAEIVGDSKIALPLHTYNGCGEGAFASKHSLNLTDPRSVGLTAPAPLKGGRRGRGRSRKCWSGGASMQLGTAPVDGMVYEAPRSGYTTASSIGAGNGGNLADGKTPFLVNVPYVTQPSASSSCRMTGGRRRKSRKSRKSRK